MNSCPTICRYCGNDRPDTPGFHDCPQAQAGKVRLDAAIAGLKRIASDRTPASVPVEPRDPESVDDHCPDGTDHQPFVETDELTTEFWGALQTTIRLTITCAKCGQECPPRDEEPYEEACSN